MTRLITIALTGLCLIVSSVAFANGSVDGFIKKDAVGQNGVQVEIRSSSDLGYIATIHSDASGFFTLNTIPMGHFTVTLFGEGQIQLAQKEADIFAVGDSVTINFLLD